MRIIVIGVGEVGSTTAADLSERHEVTVVDVDEDRVETIQYQEDVLGVAGDGTDLDVLREADLEEADMVIASTSSDEANIVACGTAKTVSDAFTIARVRKPSLLRTWERSPGAFGVDFMVSVDLLTARSLVNIVDLPGAADSQLFADGLVQMAEFSITEGSPLAGLTVQEADRYDALTFAAVIRDEETVIPRGRTRFAAGDAVVVIGRPDSVQGFAREVAPGTPEPPLEVVVVGGGTIGRDVVRLLAEEGHRVRLLERDTERARELAEAFPGVNVLEHDATDLAFLERENVGEADAVVTTLSGDERNLLVALLARRVGAARTVAVVETGDYVGPFEAVGVTAAVNPRTVTAEEITRFTRGRYAENVAMIEGDRAEVIEVVVDEDSALAGRPIRESVPDLPEGVVVGAITRGDDGVGPTARRDTADADELSFVTPRGGTVVEPGDHVVLFANADAVDALSELV